jgi:hypothetical protein
MNELGAELDRDGQARHAARPAAPADAVARLEDQDRAAGAREHVRGREAGRAGTHHDYIVL